MRSKLGVLFIVVGVLAVFSAAGLHIYNIWDEERAAETSIQIAQILLSQIVRVQHENEGLEPAQDEEADSEISTSDEINVIEVDSEFYIGVLSIPVLELDLPVNSTWSYPKLKISPCRYSGNVQGDTLVIVAHNYKMHFGDIFALKTGDSVSFTDVLGVEYSYFVAEVEMIDPTNVGNVVNSAYDLNLLTCNYDGDARVVARCIRLQNNAV